MNSEEGKMYFQIGLDNAMLKADAEKSAGIFKTIADRAKQEGVNINTSFRLSIVEQKELIKSIEADTKRLQARMEALGAGSPGASRGLQGSISANQKDLILEKEKLAAIQKEQMLANGKEESTQESLIGSLGKWAMGLATVGAAMEAAKSIIESTKDGADKFEFAVAGAKSGLDQFWRTIATGDWSNFLDNIEKAIQGGYDFAKAMDEAKKAQWGNEMEEADVQKTKYELLIALRNKLLTKDQRIEAGDKLIKLEDDLGAAKVKTAGITMAAFDKEAARISGLSKEKIVETLKQVNEETKIKAEGYLEQQKKLEDILDKGGRAAAHGDIKSADQYSSQARQIEEELKNTPQVVKTYADALTGVGKMKEEFIVGYVNAYKKVGEADAFGMQNSLRARTTLSGIKADIDKDAADAAKKAKDAEGLDNRIAATKKLMDDVKDANSQEFADLTKKLVLLEKEKELRETIVKMQMGIATNKPMESAGATSTVGAIRDMAKALGMNLDKTKTDDIGLDIPGIDKQMAKYQALAAKLRKQYHLEEKKDLKDISNEYYEVADAASQLSQAIGDTNKGLAEMLMGLSKVANAMGNLYKAGAFSKDPVTGKSMMSKSDAIGAAVSGASSLIGMVAGQVAANKQVMKDYYASIIQQQQDYNLALNQQLLLNTSIKDSVFLKDYEGSLNDSTKAYNDANAKYQQQLAAFQKAEAITGKKNVVSGGNMLSGIGAGAALGAGIGAIAGGGVLSVPAAAAGAIIGSIVGGLVGLFAKKTKDVTAPLLATYPDLIKANGDFNAELAKTLIANNKVTDASKATLQNMIDWKDAADKATAQLKSIISELSGSLGDDLRNALVDAFKAGTSAAEAFKGSVNKVLENIMSNMIFNKAFEGAFKTLEDAMAASYAVGGDQSWLDDFQKFYSQSPELIKNFNQGMADAKTAAAGVGLDIFATTTDSTRTATTKGFAAMSQDTGNDLNGRFTAIQGHTFAIVESVKVMTQNSINSLKLLAGIQDNTDYCRRLETIDGNMASLKAGIDQINLKGITLKQ